MHPNILSITDKPCLDLNVAMFRHRHADILIFGTWYMDPETRESQPALALVDAVRFDAKRKVVPCVILLADMWRWSTELSDWEYIGGQISEWLASGALPGSPFNKHDVFRVMNAVQSRLRDLAMMPPLPMKAAIRHGAVPVGDMTITERDTGKTTTIELVSEDVRK